MLFIYFIIVKVHSKRSGNKLMPNEMPESACLEKAQEIFEKANALMKGRPNNHDFITLSEGTAKYLDSGSRRACVDCSEDPGPVQLASMFCQQCSRNWCFGILYMCCIKCIPKHIENPFGPNHKTA